MYQFFVEAGQISIPDKRVIIFGPDVNHIRNVLRMKIGEEIGVSTGQDGKEYRCAIVSMEEDRILCQLRFIQESAVELPSRIYLFQALPKGDKMELIVQKAVELGVWEIIPVASKRCVVKLDQKKAGAKTARWQSIAEAAAKQSGRRIIPRVHEVMRFSEALRYAADMDVKLIPYEQAENMFETKKILDTAEPGQRIAVFIGPEGGFEAEEIGEAKREGVIPVTLGRRILRTETAAITVLSWLMYRLEQMAEERNKGNL